jgi:Ca2+-binding RTX toxin-like protein
MPALQGGKSAARSCAAAAVAASALWGVIGAGSAQAASTTCRGSAERTAVGTTVVSEPVIANSPGSPCATDSQNLAGVQPTGGLTVSDPRADTRSAAGVLAASASVESASLASAPVSVGHVSVSQVVSCSAGSAVTTGSSTVDGLTIGGNPVSVVADRQLDMNVGGVRVRTNVLNGATRQALVLDLGDNEYVIGEATAGGDACSNVGDGNGGGGGGGRICPAGATYDVPTDQCVIVLPGANGTQTLIVVGPPYAGPSGGSVMALSEARALARQGKLQKSACLRGKGPDYVILGTRGKDHITGTNRSDRILSLGGADQIDAGRGNDCVDGGTGADRLAGGEGNDRVYGQSGNDHLFGGSGSDRIWGASGNDAINTGNGRDRVWAGAGNDIINAATAGPASVISAGSGHDTVRINNNERRRVHSGERVYRIH